MQRRAHRGLGFHADAGKGRRWAEGRGRRGGGRGEGGEEEESEEEERAKRAR